MFISYPNNPAAVAAPVEYFDRAIAFAKEHDLLLVHDNAYSEIGFDGYLPPSIMERPGAREVAIELFSCSKSYNMTGWRIAFACGNAEAIKTLGTGEEQHRLRCFHRDPGSRDRGHARPPGRCRRDARHLPAPS